MVLCLVLPLAMLTWRQNMVWHSHLSLWTQAEKVSPDSISALNELGLLQMQKGDYDRAIDLFSRSIKVNPYFPILYVNIAMAYEGKGEKQTAIEYYRKFIEMDPPEFRIKTMMLREHLQKKYGITF